MTALELVEYLLKNCHELKVEDGNIIIECEDGVLTEDVVSAVRELKSEVILVLQEIEYSQAHKTTFSNFSEIAPYEAVLTSAQKSLLYADESNDNACVYNVVVAYRVKGPVNTSKLETAFNKLVFLHDVLRTQYRFENGEPRQFVGKELQQFIKIYDFSQSQDPKSCVDECIRHELVRSFNLHQEWPIRVALCSVGGNESYLLLNLHHAIVDGWSARIISDDISLLYNRDVNVEELRKKRKLHYYDYVAWREKNYRSQAFVDAEVFWIDTLKGAPHIHGIPTDRQRKRYQQDLGLKYTAVCRTVSSHDISAFSSKHLVTNTSIYQAVFAALNARYSNSSDIVYGSVVSNRHPIGFNNVVGLFANMLAIRFKLKDDMTLKQLLEEANRLNINSLKHQFYPFDELVMKLNPSRIPYCNPLVQVVLVVHDETNDMLSLDGLDVTRYRLEESYSKFDMALHIRHIDNKIWLEWDYNPELFDECSISNMSQAYEVLLQNMLHESDIVLNEIELVRRPEPNHVALQSGNEEQDVKSIYSIFRNHVLTTPRAIAITHGQRELTYQDLHGLVGNITSDLYLQYGSVSNVTVGVLLDKSIEWVASIIAISKMGGIYVPIDPAYPSDRIDYIVEDAGIQVLIKHSARDSVIKKSNLFTYNVDASVHVSGENKEVPTIEATENQIAYIIYTSGSTGRPKGVVVTSRNLFYSLSANSEIFEITPQDSMPTIGSQSFGASILETLIPIFNGCSIQILDRCDVVDMDRLYSNTINVSVFHAVPSLMFRWLDYLVENKYAENYSNLRLILVGAEPVSPDLLRRIKSIFPRVRVVELYGMTESTVVCASYEPAESDEFPFCCIGKPNKYTSFYVLNESLKQQPKGSIGTLYIGGKTIAQGYVNSKELTKQKFIRSPFREHTVLFNTGDLVRETSCGDYQFIGRSDHQIKIRGIRIELGEIEYLANEVEGVHRSIVVATRTSNNEDLLILYYLCKDERSPLHYDISVHLSSKLPNYMHPHKIIGVTEFPINSNGKVDRGKLLEIIGSKDEKTVIMSETEEELVKIIKGLLGLDSVNVTDSFFELGGNSLLLSKLAKVIQQTWSIKVAFSDLFVSSSIRSLGECIDNNVRDSRSSDDLSEANEEDEIVL